MNFLPTYWQSLRPETRRAIQANTLLSLGMLIKPWLPWLGWAIWWAGLTLLIELTWRLRQGFQEVLERENRERLQGLIEKLGDRLTLIDQRTQELLAQIEFAAGFDLTHPETRQQLAGRILARVMDIKMGCQVAKQELREIRRIKKTM